MRIFVRGVQLYLFLLAVVATLTMAWGANRFVLDNPTAAAGWPLLIGVGVGLALGGVVLRSMVRSTEQEQPTDHPW